MEEGTTEDIEQQLIADLANATTTVQVDLIDKKLEVLRKHTQ